MQNSRKANRNYFFTSDRLGFRNWIQDDILKMAELNADHEVMQFFPALQSTQQTREFIERMQKEFAEKGFCYFAVDKLENNEFIGFTGLLEQTYESDFTPCTDIGWRLKRSAWNNGFATEGARRCLDFGFSELGLKKIYATAPAINFRSESVMKKAGMQKVKHFIHPKLVDDERLKDCVLYEISNPMIAAPFPSI